jgi:cell division protein FtsN
VPSGNKKPELQYTLVADSLKSPLPMSAYFLRAPTPPDAQYSLRLGLFSKLDQATQFANNLSMKDKTTVVKASDAQRDWYMVLLGPFTSKASATENRQRLQNEQISATLMLWPPEPESDG